jgi:hypothetical protein
MVKSGNSVHSQFPPLFDTAYAHHCPLELTSGDHPFQDLACHTCQAHPKMGHAVHTNG